MKKNLFIIAAFAISLAFSTVNSFAQPVTAEFLTYGASGALNKVRMDRPGVPYSHGVEGVKAEFYSTGSRDLVIGLNIAKAKRNTIFDFSEVASYTGAPAWIYSTPVQTFKPYFNVLGAYYAKQNCSADANGVYNCNYTARMNAGYLSAAGDSGSYALLWNPTAVNRPVNSPETTSSVNVNYIKDASGERFIITPLPNIASGRVIAGLEKTASRTVSGAGQYVMPFTLVVRPK